MQNPYASLSESPLRREEINLQSHRESMPVPADRQNKAAIGTRHELLAKTLSLDPSAGKEIQVHPKASKQGDISFLVLSSLALGVCCFALNLSAFWKLIWADNRGNTRRFREQLQAS